MSTIIREFRYSDPYKGWGDEGTVGIYVLDKTFPNRRYGWGEVNPAFKYFYEHVKPNDGLHGLQIITKEEAIKERAELRKKMARERAILNQLDKAIRSK